MTINDRIEGVVDRLSIKMQMSQIEVPGFIIGLSGTDSIIAFEMLARALARVGRSKRLMGIHYVTMGRKPGAFLREAMPWLHERHPEAQLIVAEPLGGNHDPQRWADLQLRALHEFMASDYEMDEYDRARPELRLRQMAPHEQYWVAGTINATEFTLGKHSIGANAVSIQPIRSLWKTTVLEMCAEIGAPQIIIDNARLPDCLCGRDEIAAQHIELIDDILKYSFDPSEHDADLVKTLISWIADRRREGGFRARIPYIV